MYIGCKMMLNTSFRRTFFMRFLFRVCHVCGRPRRWLNAVRHVRNSSSLRTVNSSCRETNSRTNCGAGRAGREGRQGGRGAEEERGGERRERGLQLLCYLNCHYNCYYITVVIIVILHNYITNVITLTIYTMFNCCYKCYLDH